MPYKRSLVSIKLKCQTNYRRPYLRCLIIHAAIFINKTHTKWKKEFSPGRYKFLRLTLPVSRPPKTSFVTKCPKEHRKRGIVSGPTRQCQVSWQLTATPISIRRGDKREQKEVYSCSKKKYLSLEGSWKEHPAISRREKAVVGRQSHGFDNFEY